MTPETPSIAHGVIAPNLTPFEDDLSIANDLELENTYRLIEDGCAALAPFGTTGEALSVSTAERLDLLDHLVGNGIDPKHLIPGTGHDMGLARTRGAPDCSPRKKMMDPADS